MVKFNYCSICVYVGDNVCFKIFYKELVFIFGRGSFIELYMLCNVGDVSYEWWI